VYDHHDLVPELYCAIFSDRGNRLMYRALLGLEKLSLRWADHVIATNESYKVMEMERGRVAEERITIVRNAPELHGRQTTEPDPGLRQKDRTIIGYVGVMGFQDGVDYLLRALHHLVRDLGRADVFLVLIGGLGVRSPVSDNSSRGLVSMSTCGSRAGCRMQIFCGTSPAPTSAWIRTHRIPSTIARP